VKLLGFETSSERGSVALLIGNDVVQADIATPREQTQKLLDLAAELLADGGCALAELNGIAFGRGPGSFTGLRVAAAVAQGFALTTGVALLPVSSLAALAQGAWRTARVAHCLIALDARMGEIYCGEFEIAAGLAVPRRAEALLKPARLVAPAGAGWAALGNGFAVHAQALAPVCGGAERVLTDVSPAARDLFPLAAADLAAGRSAAVEDALPVYLRDHTAWQR
jgi:tRNA threonylcarbamoyladenosine biosynthesis protein TsaB